MIKKEEGIDKNEVPGDPTRSRPLGVGNEGWDLKETRREGRRRLLYVVLYPVLVDWWGSPAPRETNVHWTVTESLKLDGTVSGSPGSSDRVLGERRKRDPSRILGGGSGRHGCTWSG